MGPIHDGQLLAWVASPWRLGCSSDRATERSAARPRGRPDGGDGGVHDLAGAPASHAVASHIARERGRPEEADAHLIAGENIVASGTKHLFGLEMLILERARVAWHHQDVDDACDLLLAMWDTTAPIRGLIQWRLIGPDAVKLCLAAGRHREADGIVTGLGLTAGRSTAPSAAATMQRCAGLVKRDSRMLAVAADAMLATDRLAEAAGACEDAAEALIDSGARARDEDLVRMLDAAEQIHLRASATTGLTRVRQLRSRGGIVREEPTPRPTFGWDSLTPKEQEVVTLVSLRHVEPGGRSTALHLPPDRADRGVGPRCTGRSHW